MSGKLNLYHFFNKIINKIMKNSWKLFSYKETPVYLKYWFLLIFFFIPIDYTIILFFSLLVHELAHVWMGNKLGYKSEYIYLSIINGAAKIDEKFLEKNKDVIKISIAGPLSNLILTILSFLIFTLFHSINSINGTETPIVYDFIVKFSVVNFLLFITNLIPIIPLDGGRISKSIFSIIFGNEKGKFINAIFSLIICVLLLVLSIYIKYYIASLFLLFLMVMPISEMRK